LVGFMGLHIDIDAVCLENMKLKGPGVVRKNGAVVNQGDKLQPE